jgi:hypothetical protein
MRRLRSGDWGWVMAILSFSLWGIGCGGHPPAGQSSFPARVNLTPGSSTSVQLGSFINFIASAQNAAGNNVAGSFTFASSDTSILNIAPNGAGCAGRWDAAFTTCTPGGTGVVQVTASTQNVTSAPTFVFVHPPIDNITVTGVLLDGLPIPEPCLSQSQTMTVEAHAFSQGSDITASVGTFIWSADNTSVVGLTPLNNSAYNFPTNQATATAATPGIAHIFATASGVSSNSFQQPQLLDKSQNPIPVVFDFFETCPIQNITLELGHAGSLQTSFAINKGTSETVIATVSDVMGHSSLPNSSNGIVLSKIPLTWTASQPGVIAAGTGCGQSCALATPSPGAGSVTASCSPPTCNIGFPQKPPVLSSALCAQYFPPSCQQFIPLPVYASPLPPLCPTCTVSSGAISGLVTGASTSNSVLATSMGCANEPPATCSTGLYSIATAKAATGSANAMPTAPNSLLSTLAGDRVYMGSDFGAQVINPANLGTQNGAFTALGTVTGRVLAVSANGNIAIFSDTLHTPNQVYVVNSSNATSPSVTALNISEAPAAAFSPDGLKALIFGIDGNGNRNLYVYSPLQELQVINLPAQTSVNSILFSANGAFAYVVEPSRGGGGPAVTVFNTCDNQISTSATLQDQIIPLAASPIAFRALPDGLHFVALESDGTIEYITATITGIPPATPSQPATSVCPMFVSHATPQKIDLGQGTFQPLNFFVSADSTLLYVLSSARNSILVYDFTDHAVTGIQLLGPTNPTPVTADMTVDDSTILVAGSDGALHEVSTALGGADLLQLPFPDLANFQNSFCTFTPASGPCVFDFVAAKP